MGDVHFFVFSSGSILFWGEICSKKSKLFVEAEIKNLDYSKYVEFNGHFHFFLDRKYPFWVKLAQ